MPVTASCWVQARCITRRVCQRPVLEPTDLMDRGVSGTREEVGRPAGAWCRPAVSGGGLCQVSCYRRNATLHGAWWRPTVPTGGLLQPRCCTQRVLQALCEGCTGDSTVRAAHCRAGDPDQSGHGQRTSVGADGGWPRC